MKSKYFNAYRLDLEYEFETYKHVGKDYGNRKNSNKGLILNLARFFRKHVTNKKEQKYKFCNTYSEWKNHVKSIIPQVSNGIDMLRFLNQKKRYADILLETAKIILIPIYIALLQMNNIFKLSQVETIVFLFIITAISTWIISDASTKVNFYEDFIEIAKSKIIDYQETMD